MEQQSHYLISDAAKQVEVESHVLRYWEEELQIPIKRNELGHRYYTREDVDRFKEIKNLKEQGLQLKAIRMILKDGKLERLDSGSDAGSTIESMLDDNKSKHMIEVIDKRELNEFRGERAEKGARLQMLLQHMIADVVKENNKELCDDIKASILKEMDYQFRMQGEREETREQERREKEEEHFKRIDELLRNYSNKKKGKTDEEKQSRFSARKKHSVV